MNGNVSSMTIPTDEELATAAARGDIAARNAFIERHMGLIRFHCFNSCRDLDGEYLSDAVAYVCDRLSKYDGSASPKTIAFNYLPHWLARCRRYESRLIAGPRTSNGKTKTPGRYAKEVEQTGSVRSLSCPIGDYGKLDLYSIVVDREPYRDPPSPDRLEWARAIIDSLDERSRAVILGRMAGRTLVEIGFEFGLTRERVRQIEKDAMGFIKEIARIAFARRRSA